MTQADMRDKICIVTGSTSGIGKATALGLAKLGATVVLVARDKDRGEATRTEIQTRSGNDAVDLLLADLASQASIRQLAQDVQQKYPRLDVLVNNAGISPTKRTLTEDGIEKTFAVNVLAYFLLTNLLLDLLKDSAPSRIVNVASEAQSPMNFDDVQREKHFGWMDVYSQSKFATILFTYELAKRLQGTGVTVNCLHPGVIGTNLMRELPPIAGWFTKLFFSSPEKGAQTSIYLASSPEVEGVSGKYFIKCKEARSSKESYDEAAQQRLWQMCAGLTKLDM
ncbi:MAG TPA: SDR family oxidoreductase [Ktedonobacteraceae bacterium]|nr:SDR family oxidoreductase [Ktedonobacteraceae bacterium]